MEVSFHKQAFHFVLLFVCCFFLNLPCINLLLLFTEEAAGVIGNRGGIQDILAAMRSFPNDADVCANCCAALSCLTISGKSH